MHPGFLALDARVRRLTTGGLIALSLATLLLVAVLDFVTGYELAMSVFYLFPVTIGAWYADRRAAIALALASSVCWYAADLATGHVYSHPAIPVWNALVRLSFFLICGLLVARLRQSLSAEQRLARHDALTGLYSRSAFLQRLEHDLELAARSGTPLTLAYADLDGFKGVNDSGGHAAGDRVLKAAAGALSAALRSADTVARLGGDEFAMVLPATAADTARAVLQRVREEFSAAMRAAGWPVGVSIGVVTFVAPPASVDDAVRAADELMYEVKRQGKNRSAFAVVQTGSAIPR